MASRQVMRSVSADFCASAGAAIASVVQAASSAPRSQVSDRIYLVLSIPKRRRRQEQTPPGRYDAGHRSNPHATALAWTAAAPGLYPSADPPLYPGPLAATNRFRKLSIASPCIQQAKATESRSASR